MLCGKDLHVIALQQHQKFENTTKRCVLGKCSPNRLNQTCGGATIMHGVEEKYMQDFCQKT
jgi:hypothetical protein